MPHFKDVPKGTKYYLSVNDIKYTLLKQRDAKSKWKGLDKSDDSEYKKLRKFIAELTLKAGVVKGSPQKITPIIKATLSFISKHCPEYAKRIRLKEDFKEQFIKLFKSFK